ncbi:glycoside hydrolase family 130 protein [Vibrio alginolyticus]|nr:glycoside hydrolase family 130 protein [Vibrio alginolyticus]
MSVRILGESIPNMPWQDRPQGEEGVMWRHSENPIIGRNPFPAAARVYNSAVVPFEGAFIGVFRCDYKNGRPHLHVGRSGDALNWEFDHQPIQWKSQDGNDFQPSYAYDPRVVKIEDTYYVTWCTDDHGATLGAGMTKDFKTFTRLENACVPFNRNGVLFPRKINDQFVMLNRPSDSGHTPFGDIFLSHSNDMEYWGKHRHVMGKGGNGWWQGTKIGAGPIPIETSEGWLMIYHGVSGTCNGFVYSFGAALLDIDEPWKVLYRTRDYILTPEKDYETTGFVPNVAFPCAALADADTGRIAVYYGAADTYSAVAYTTIEDIMTELKTQSEVF